MTSTFFGVLSILTITMLYFTLEITHGFKFLFYYYSLCDVVPDLMRNFTLRTVAFNSIQNNGNQKFNLSKFY